MSKITHAFLHIPTFRELAPISTDSQGKWTIDDVPPLTYKALGPERFTAWKNEVMAFIDAGRICGNPEGLTFELLASPNPDADWLSLQSLAAESIKILAENSDDHPASIQSIRIHAISLELAHVDSAGLFRAGRPK